MDLGIHGRGFIFDCIESYYGLTNLYIQGERQFQKFNLEIYKGYGYSKWPGYSGGHRDDPALLGQVEKA